MFKYIFPVILAILISFPSEAGYEKEVEYSPGEIKSYFIEIAKENGFNTDEFWLVAWGESKFNLKSRGDYNFKIGKYRSYGIWQINLSVHDIGIDCATNLYCSTDYAIKLWKETPMHWSCYRELVGEFKSNNCGYKKIAIPPVVWAKDDK